MPETPITQIPSTTSTSPTSPNSSLDDAETQAGIAEYIRRTGGKGVFIERPLAPPRPGGVIVDDPSYGTFVPDAVTKTSVEATRAGRVSTDYRKGFIRLSNAQLAENKYHSIHSLKEADKINALKDPKLDPNLIEDGYDQLAHNMHLWTIVGAKAKASGNISFDEQAKIASNFYDRMIAPAYGHIYKDKGSAEPLSKDVWMKQAYGEALDYKLENAYTNDWYNSLKHGWNTGLAATARAADRVVTMGGNVFNDAVAQWRKEAANRELLRHMLGGVPTPEAYTNWVQRMADINHQLDESKKEYNENIIQRGARWQSAHREFWADVLPLHDGFMNHATSFVAEQAGQAPIFSALSLATAPLGVAIGATGLTAALSKTAAGRIIVGSLTAGAEGLAYGAAVRKQDDPGEMWRDALGFAVFHTVFSTGSEGLKKLIDMAPAESKLMRELKRRQDLYVLAREGNRPATPVEVYDDHKTETANNIFVTGIPGQRAIYVDALHHIAEMETVGDEAKVKDIESKLLANDPARWAPVLSAAKFVRTILGGKKLSEVEPGSAEEKNLSTRLAQLIIDSASEMNTRVEGMSNAAEAKAPKNLAQPSAKYTLAYYVEKIQSDLAKAPGSGGMFTKNQIQKAAEKMYAADLHNAAEDAEEEVEAPKVIKAQNVAKRSKPEKIAALKISSKRTVDKYGQPAVSYNVKPEYKAQLKLYSKAAKASSQTLSQFFENMSDEDFEHDLTQHFFPEALRKAGVFFEGQNTREGMQNPNFLAFMYNYLPDMPREFGKELESRLIDTMKVQKYMRGKEPTAPQLLYFAKSMYNHVDNFLGSGRWPQESNLFRSSNESMFKTTEWQRQLLIEKTIQEQKNLKDMFSGKKNKKALSLALKTHAAFSKLRMNEFDKASPKRNSPEIIKAYDDVIADLQTKTGEYDRWVF